MAACTAGNREMIRMIRATKSEEEERTAIIIDGRLSNDCIEVVETCCNQAVLEGKPVNVFLRDVLTIDESGRALLARLAAKGIRLRAAGIYTSHVLRILWRPVLRLRALLRLKRAPVAKKKSASEV